MHIFLECTHTHILLGKLEKLLDQNDIITLPIIKNSSYWAFITTSQPDNIILMNVIYYTYRNKQENSTLNIKSLFIIISIHTFSV